MQTNSFQGVLITDGMDSYTMFIYRCGYMEWSDEPTIIGFKITLSYYQNNPYSGNYANNIACVNNSSLSEWNNVLYTLYSRSMFIWLCNAYSLNRTSKIYLANLKS